MIVEIASDGLRASISRGSLVITDHDGAKNYMPIDDVLAVIFSARACTITRKLMSAMAEHNIIGVICGDNFMPVSMLMPISANYRSAEVASLQIQASRPLCKQLWKFVVQKKIMHQAAVLEALRSPEDAGKLRAMAMAVKSGDAENMEARAARHYWPRLMGKSFVRNPDAPGLNALLNYGYAVLRSMTARAVCAAGLWPALGMHHRNKRNPFCLVDDVMEPYRPVVDHLVASLPPPVPELDPQIKRTLCDITLAFTSDNGSETALGSALKACATSLAKSYHHKKSMLCIPEPLFAAKAVAQPPAMA